MPNPAGGTPALPSAPRTAWRMERHDPFRSLRLEAATTMPRKHH